MDSPLNRMAELHPTGGLVYIMWMLKQIGLKDVFHNIFDLWKLVWCRASHDELSSVSYAVNEIVHACVNVHCAHCMICDTVFLFSSVIEYRRIKIESFPMADTGVIRTVYYNLKERYKLLYKYYFNAIITNSVTINTGDTEYKKIFIKPNEHEYILCLKEHCIMMSRIYNKTKAFEDKWYCNKKQRIQ